MNKPEKRILDAEFEHDDTIEYVSKLESYIKYLEKSNSSIIIIDVSDILGYFDYLGDRWHIAEIDGKMLKGWRLTPKGKKHTIWIHSNNVMNLVESCR